MTATLPISNASQKEVHEAFAKEVALLYDDPLRYVLTMFPWGQPGSGLENGSGPDTWQTQALIDIGNLVKERDFDGHTPVAPIRFTRSSGHDTGKTTLAAWVSCWIKDTRPDSIGTVTANTFTQLETKTWAAIQKWTKLALTRDWWEVGATKIYNKLQSDKRETWFLACQSSSEENSEAFAGQHSKFSTSYYIFDESSSIPDEIWKVAEGGLTDGEPMIFAFGNPTRNTGMFYEVNFGNKRHRWNHGTIDSRTSGISNKETIEEWRQDYGEDSDFFRVRVRGLAPMASEDQLIPRDLIEGAQGRKVSVLDDEPLIAGVDVPFGGAAWFVIRFRRGLDGRSVPPVRVAGSKIERPEMISRCATLLSERDPRKRIAMMFFDTAFGAPIVERLRSLGFDNVMEVNFGSVKTPDDRFYNMRSYMWAKQLKEWLSRGAIDKNDTKLMIDMMAPGFHLNNRNQFVLESKESMTKRGIAPVDDGDALCFVENTMVMTAHGERPIQDIKLGEIILTPFGYSPAVSLWRTNTESLTTVRFSSGKGLSGKPNHDVFTFSGGVKRIDALSLTDEVEVLSRWRRFLWQLVSLSYIGARNFGFKQVAHTLTAAGRVANKKSFFIAGCGLTIAGLFQKASRFTTRMKTGAITIMETLNSSLLGHINVNTCSADGPSLENLKRTESISTWQEKRRQSGTDPQRVVRGTASMVSERGRDESQGRQLAHAVGASTIPSLLAGLDQKPGNSVQSRARKPSPSGAISRTLESVRSAARNSWLTVIGRRPVVPASVETVSVPLTATYNLTLLEHNAYYANGILVFNCLTFAQPVAPIRKRQEPVIAGGAWS